MGNATIGINIKSNNIAATTYSFDTTFTNHFASYTVNNVVKHAKSGSVTFSAINAGISFIGTFSFTCTDGTQVTGGMFTAVQ